MLCRGIVALVTFAAAITSATAQISPFERGRYLVEAVMACDGCHTPRPGGVLDMQRRFSGGSQVWDEPAYTVRGANITQDVETGIGAWSTEDIKKLLSEGMRPNGVQVAHEMPYPFYKILQSQQDTPSLDNLVGTNEQRRWLVEADCLGSLEIDDQLKLRGYSEPPNRLLKIAAAGWRASTFKGFSHSG